MGPVPTDPYDTGLVRAPVRDCAARSLLERGRLEVDGKPRDGKQRPDPDHWERHELMDGVYDLTQGHRSAL